MWLVYILKCRDGRFYTGITTDLVRRVKEHSQGIGGKFTRSFGPVELVYQEVLGTESEAKAREAQLKTWSRAKKLALIEGNCEKLKLV